jgi:hypothetical protein
MDIAVEYGIRLGASRKLVTTLAAKYPHHGFVIDFAESQDLFNCVRRPSEAEMELAVYLGKYIKSNFDEEVIRYPSSEGFLAYGQPSEINSNEDSCLANNSAEPTKESNQSGDVPISKSNDHNGERPGRKAAKKKQKAQSDPTPPEIRV